MSMKQAVQTCVLSSRWKELWKQLTDLALNSSDFTDLTHFSKFVSWVMSNRDSSISLHSLDLRRKGCIDHELLDRIMGYAVSHDVQQLTIEVNLSVIPGFRLHHSVFSCKSLTYLKLSIWAVPWMTQLPSSLQLPALKSLHLEHVTFTAASESDCAEPFSACHMLDTLVLDRFNLHQGVKFLSICNSNLSSLTIGSTIQEAPYKFVLSTPNLRYLAVMRDPLHQLSACKLCFLEQVSIDCEAYFHTHFERTYSALISLLQVLADYVKIMILSTSTLKILHVSYFILFYHYILLFTLRIMSHVPNFYPLVNLAFQIIFQNVSPINSLCAGSLNFWFDDNSNSLFCSIEVTEIENEIFDKNI